MIFLHPLRASVLGRVSVERQKEALTGAAIQDLGPQKITTKTKLRPEELNWDFNGTTFRPIQRCVVILKYVPIG